jgi:hypothetical protein
VEFEPQCREKDPGDFMARPKTLVKPRSFDRTPEFGNVSMASRKPMNS